MCAMCRNDLDALDEVAAVIHEGVAGDTISDLSLWIASRLWVADDRDVTVSVSYTNDDGEQSDDTFHVTDGWYDGSPYAGHGAVGVNVGQSSCACGRTGFAVPRVRPR